MKAVILDMYGVVLRETGAGLVPFVNRTFPDLSHGDVYLHWERANVGEMTSHELFAQLGYQGDLAEVERQYLDTVEMDGDFYDFAKAIRKRHKLALITNDISEWSTYLRDKYQINTYFDVISVSGDLKMGKPDKGIFELTLEKLGCRAADCAYIDDWEYNLDAAKALGMDVILFNRRNVAYDGRIVNSFKELAELLGE